MKTSDFIQSEIEAQTTAAGTGTNYDLLIIGGGPAGLAAALYATRAGLKTLLVEQAILGGAANSTFQIENYPGFPQNIKGPELVHLMAEQVKNLGVEILFASVSRAVLKGQRKMIFTEDGRMFSANSLIIASGSTVKKLNVPGEEEFLGRGISYCAVCDGPFYKGQKVAVIGGGDAAVEEALYLSDFAASVVIIHRRDQLRAAKILQKEAFDRENIHFLWDSEVREFRGSKRLAELVVFNKKDNTSEARPFAGCFIYIGILPALGFVAEELERDAEGFIITDENMQTSVTGVFAAGDVRQKSLKQIVTATADGAVAAISAYHYLKAIR